MMEKNEIVKTGDGFIDRSKVRILLCDNDSKSSEEVFTLLCKCSYQGYEIFSAIQFRDNFATMIVVVVIPIFYFYYA